MAFGGAYLNSNTTTVELTSTSVAAAYIDYVNIVNLSANEGSYMVYYTDTGGSYASTDNKVIIRRGPIQPNETIIFTRDDFPKGDSNGTLLGNDGTNYRLYVESLGETTLQVLYKRIDLNDVVVGSEDYTTEAVQDIVGAMFTGNTETNITATYEDSDGTIDLVSTDTNTTYDVMGSGNGYAAGLVKAGGVLHLNAFLRKDGSWAIPPDTDTTYSEATSSDAGLMSTAHHDKLDGIATGAEVNVNADWNSSSGDSQILNKPTLPADTVATGLIKWQQAKVTLSEAQLNALDSTPITLIAAQGADTIIMCGDALALIDRDASTAQAQSTCDLVIGYNSTTDYNKAILYERRFMYNEGGDRTWSLKADYSGEVAASLTGAVDVPVTVAFTNACTSGSLDSVTFYIQYYVIDNS